MRLSSLTRSIAPRLAPVIFLAALAPGAQPAQAPYQTESEAVAKGRTFGLGAARLEGPEQAEVYTYGTWTLAYTAGTAGIKPGGGIRIGLRHLHQWTPPQTKKPQGPGYLTVHAARNVPVKVYAATDWKRFFSRYFPWQNMTEVILPHEGLEPGETIRVTYGDRRKGSPGIRVQPFDESRFVFKVYVDGLGNDDYLPLEHSPGIRIVAAAPHRLAVIMPSDAVIGESTRCIVRAEDRYGNPAVRYRGTVSFRTSDTGATLPEPHTFTAGDKGAHRFASIVFQTPGFQTVRVSDGSLTASGNPVRTAVERPVRTLLWGDLHAHTLFSDGRGTVEELYAFARDFAGLDFCAVTDHAFEMHDHMWKHAKSVTNRFNRPGRFVTFQAYEWSGVSGVGGDHNVYFLEDDPPLFRTSSYYDPQNLQMYHGPRPKVDHVTDLFARLGERLKQKNVLCIPHWGGRPGNQEWHEPKVQRLIEVFSEHRRSEDWTIRFLARGHRVGIMASTDSHYGNPGYGYLRPTHQWDSQEIGMAAVAVYAPALTRQAVFRALYDRHVYATTGDRIVLEVLADGHPMGAEYRTTTAPTLTIRVAGTGPIRRVEIKKNAQTVHTREPDGERVDFTWRDPSFQTDRTAFYYVQVVQENGEEAITSPLWVN